MGKYAFDSAGSSANKTLIVVNIDQHSDAGTASQKYVASDSWGIPLIKNYGKGVYVSLSTCGISKTEKEDAVAVESRVSSKSAYSVKESPIFKKDLIDINENAMKKHWLALNLLRCSKKVR